jgi:hypothetical protein
MDLRDIIIKKQWELINMILYDEGNDVRIPLDVKVRLAITEIDSLKLKLVNTHEQNNQFIN